MMALFEDFRIFKVIPIDPEDEQNISTESIFIFAEAVKLLLLDFE